MITGFELLLFSTDRSFIREAVRAGVDGIVVDWERLGKSRRQAGADTLISQDTMEDLARVRSSTGALVICRLNGFGPWTRTETEQALAGGADEILLPMVRRGEEVAEVLDYVRSRCPVGILIETVAALEILGALSRLPLSRAYVGLNDLAIERQSPTIFTALIDGTVERIREQMKCTLGFGGLTLPDRGDPIPCRLLIAEMARLKCDFSFLRRSFHRDIAGHDLSEEIPRMRKAIQEAFGRSPEAIAADRALLEQAIQAWPTVSIQQSRTSA